MFPEETKAAQISANEKDSPGASIQDESDREWQKTGTAGNGGTFDAAEGHHFYRPIDSYEGLHRWDPDFQWTDDEEKKIVRKVIQRSCRCIAPNDLTFLRLISVSVHLHV